MFLTAVQSQTAAIIRALFSELTSKKSITNNPERARESKMFYSLHFSETKSGVLPVCFTVNSVNKNIANRQIWVIGNFIL